MAGKYTMQIDQGSDYTILLTLQDELGVRINLTGHIFSGDIRKTAGDTVTLASFDFNILTQSGGTLGQVEVTLPAADSSAIPVSTSKTAVRTPVSLAYDIESNNAGAIVRWLEGEVLLNPEVTK